MGLTDDAKVVHKCCPNIFCIKFRGHLSRDMFDMRFIKIHFHSKQSIKQATCDNQSYY